LKGKWEEVINKCKKTVIDSYKGKWTQVVTNKDNKEVWKAKRYNVPLFILSQTRLPSDSYFRPDIMALITKENTKREMDAISLLKDELENQQRKDKLLREAQNKLNKRKH
jgi:hypothetical protein